LSKPLGNASGAHRGRRSSAPFVAELDAPAKVNLGLRIRGVRDDGYHELDGLFVPLDLADRIRLEVRDAGAGGATLEISTAAGVPGEVPADASNLAVQAAEAFLARARVRARVALRLTKRIPSPGGLGGGSSDAAAVLRALHERFPSAFPRAELAALALELGADVPFFLGPTARGPEPSRVGGIGERLWPEPGLPALALALAHPGQSLETARVYAEFDADAGSLTDPRGASTMPALQGPEGRDDPLHPGRWRSADWLSQQLANDLEPAARRLCPAIGGMREALAASGALAVGLSGSGPTVFGIFPDAPAASKALEGAAFRSHAFVRSGGWACVAMTVASRESA